jgi:hypothetical protein
MTINTKTIAIALSLIFLAGIPLADALGFWETESRKIPAKYESGEFAGISNPADIRGSYSFNDISNAFPISVEILADAYGVATSVKNINDFQLKQLEEIYPDLGDDVEIGTGSVKYFVALYVGLPYDEEGDGLPLRAVEILYDEGKIDEVKRDELMKIAINLDLYKNYIQAEESSSNNIVSEESHEKVLINANTLINDLYSNGITDKEMIEVLGEIPPNKNTKLRDYCTEKGLSFSDVKSKFTGIIENRQ